MNSHISVKLMPDSIPARLIYVAEAPSAVDARMLLQEYFPGKSGYVFVHVQRNCRQSRSFRVVFNRSTASYSVAAVVPRGAA